MGAIIDVLLIGVREKAIILEKYPRCLLCKLPGSGQVLQKYRLIIPDEELDDTYYCFSVDHTISSASSNFRNRLDSDEAFAVRMRKRALAGRSVKDIDVDGVKSADQEN